MRVSVEEGYRIWAPVYDVTPNPLLALEHRAVTRLLGSNIPERVIDIGCGTGRWLRQFQELGSDVIGIDLCKEMLSEADRSPSLRGRLVLSEATSLPIHDASAGLVLCSFVVAYVGDAFSLFAEMARVCVPGGRIIVTDMHWLAAAAGWRRSFKIGPCAYDLEHFHRSTRQLRTAASSTGLRLETQIDGFFDEPERPIFQQAGKEELLSRLSAIPAVWIGVWAKP